MKLKTQIVTILKYSNCDKTQNFNLLQNSKTPIVTKLKPQIVTKLKKTLQELRKAALRFGRLSRC